MTAPSFIYASGPSSGGALVTVMQAADSGLPDHSAVSRRAHAATRSLLCQTEMRPIFAYYTRRSRRSDRALRSAPCRSSPLSFSHEPVFLAPRCLNPTRVRTALSSRTESKSLLLHRLASCPPSASDSMVPGSLRTDAAKDRHGAFDWSRQPEASQRPSAWSTICGTPMNKAFSPSVIVGWANIASRSAV